MKILGIGCTGFLGTALTEALLDRGHSLTIVTHGSRPSSHPRLMPVPWSSPWETLIEKMDVIINLAGSPIAGGRWSAARKKEILDSRLTATHRIQRHFSQGSDRARVWINASAVGYYGDGGTNVLNEKSPVGSGFLADICQKWETAARLDPALGVRCVQLRTGIVLGSEGFLAAQLPIFRLGLGGPLGSGAQFLPWIHWRDWVQAALFVLDHPITGPVNLVAPQAVAQRDFARALGKQLHRPAFLPLPAGLLQLLLGDMSSLLLAGQNAKPAVLVDRGFHFEFTELGLALADILKR